MISLSTLGLVYCVSQHNSKNQKELIVTLDRTIEKNMDAIKYQQFNDFDNDTTPMKIITSSSKKQINVYNQKNNLNSKECTKLKSPINTNNGLSKPGTIFISPDVNTVQKNEKTNAANIVQKPNTLELHDQDVYTKTTREQTKPLVIDIHPNKKAQNPTTSQNIINLPASKHNQINQLSKSHDENIGKENVKNNIKKTNIFTHLFKTIKESLKKEERGDKVKKGNFSHKKDANKNPKIPQKITNQVTLDLQKEDTIDFKNKNHTKMVAINEQKGLNNKNITTYKKEKKGVSNKNITTYKNDQKIIDKNYNKKIKSEINKKSGNLFTRFFQNIKKSPKKVGKNDKVKQTNDQNKQTISSDFIFNEISPLKRVEVQDKINEFIRVQKIEYIDQILKQNQEILFKKKNEITLTCLKCINSKLQEKYLDESTDKIYLFDTTNYYLILFNSNSKSLTEVINTDKTFLKDFFRLIFYKNFNYAFNNFKKNNPFVSADLKKDINHYSEVFNKFITNDIKNIYNDKNKNKIYRTELEICLNEIKNSGCFDVKCLNSITEILLKYKPNENFIIHFIKKHIFK